MVTFEEARQIAYDKLTAGWQDVGTFYVSDKGYENSEYYSLVVGAKEYIVDGNESYCIDDNGAVIVSKTTGELFEVPYNDDFFEEFTEVSTSPPIKRNNYITFEEARQLAYDELITLAGEDYFTNHVISLKGQETDEYWIVKYGHKEFIINGNKDYMADGPLPYVISKENGDFKFVTLLELRDILDTSTEVTLGS